jgi:tRNA pseudouridine38-40 synthase
MWSIRTCEAMPDTFHARFDVVKSKHTATISSTAPIAAGHRPPVRLAHPQAVGHGGHGSKRPQSALLGTHDFKAFEGTGSPATTPFARSPIRRLKGIPASGNLTYDIQANGFLRFMVRNIVGTLVEVGWEKWRQKDGSRPFLQSKDRSRAGATAPPQGLFLMDVIYG